MRFLSGAFIRRAASSLVSSIILLSEDAAAGSLEYAEGEAGSKSVGDGSIASQADAGNDARGGSVGRVTRTTGPTPMIVYWTLGTNIKQRIVALFAVVRVNQSARTWTMEAWTRTDFNQTNTLTRPQLVLDGSDSVNPRVVFLGYSVAPVAEAGHERFYIRLDVDDPTASPTFDIDCVVALGMDRPYSRSITLVPDEFADSVDEIHIKPWDESKSPHPIVYVNSALHLYTGWRGDAFLCSVGTKLSAMILATKSNGWVWTDTFDAPHTFDWDFTRTRAYQMPQ